MFQSGDHGRSEWPRADRHLGANGAGPQAPEPLMTPSDEAAFTHGPAHGPMSGRGGKQFFFRSTGHPHLSTDPFLVYDGWNVVEVLNAQNATTQRYTWGLDLSGQSGDSGDSGIHGAGGIGGLLAVVETAGTHQGSYWYLYDANGNVGQVLDASDPQNIAPAAHYEYDPYGNSLAATGPYAAANPFRFSTKWLEANWLYYYGYRYYSPGLGRWISRDPIEEMRRRRSTEGMPTAKSRMLLGMQDDQLLQYGFVANDPLNRLDPLGLSWWTPPICFGMKADCCACVAGLVGKIGGGFAGCAIGCAEADLPPNLSYGQCVGQCLMQFFNPCELYNQFKKNPAEWIALAACGSCLSRNPCERGSRAPSANFAAGGSGGGVCDRPPDGCEGDDCFCGFYLAWCEWANDRPPGDGGQGWKRNAPCLQCYRDCQDSGEWSFSQCPMGGPRGPRWPSPVLPTPGEY